MEDISKLWAINVGKIWRLFEGQAGVVLVSHPAVPRKKRFATLRISESAVTRVYAELTGQKQERGF